MNLTSEAPPAEALARSLDVAGYWTMLGERLADCDRRLVAKFFCRLSPKLVTGIVSHIAGGKQLRGRLVCAVCEALGGRFAEALPRAMAIECVQAASLIHDDWVDGDRVRRNAPATWTVQGARRAVLLADVMFATSLERCAELGRIDVQVLARAIAAVAAGACQEPACGETRSSISYARLLFLKTGALFGAAAELGASAAKADNAMRRAAHEYGVCMGEAYQLADDMNDLVRAEPMSRAGPAVSMLLASFGLLDGALEADAVMECLARRRRQLEQAMEDQIAARLDSAQLVLRRLPPRCYDMLELIPGELLNRRAAH